MRWLIRHDYVRVAHLHGRAVYTINPQRRGWQLVAWVVRGVLWLGFEPKG